jgi:hypothetical protein
MTYLGLRPAHYIVAGIALVVGIIALTILSQHQMADALAHPLPVATNGL